MHSAFKFAIAAVLASLVFVIGPLCAGDLQQGDYILKPFSRNFERLAKVVGVWEGTVKHPDGTKEDVTVEYRLTSGNSALLETLFKDSPHEMVSVYHDDGDAIMMNHFCGLGNQPRMRATGFDKNQIHFQFVDASNMASPAESHMHALTITFIDDQHIRHEWENFEDGKKQHTAVFALTRKK